MNNSNNKVDEAQKNTTVVGGDTVDTATGEVLNPKNENTQSSATAEKEEKKTEEKRIMSESEAREYIASLGFKHIDIPELYETMQVPSCSRYEFRMAAYIMLWARKNGIDYEFDKKGNIYLTKGTLEEGEFYPCVTSHMDTVQDKSKPYALAGAELPLRTRRVQNEQTKQNRHEIYIDGQGIGADDKLGVYISLQLMKKFDKIKAVFFVEEEIGMMGSKELKASWFDDVAYVIGWDSPELLRAAWKCSGTRLFSYDFYVNHLAPVVKKWGFVDKYFHSEPFTDVINIREKTGVMCMNFGNGGYLAHAQNEYLVIEHVDHATGMGEDIIRTIGNKTRFCSAKKSVGYGAGVTYANDPEKEDNEKLGRLFNEYTYSNYGSSSGTYHKGGATGTHTSTPGTVGNRSDGNVNAQTDKDALNEETFKYVVNTYEEYISNIKEQIEKKSDVIVDAIKDKFREAGIDFSTFGIDIKKELTEAFNKDIQF